MLAASRVVSYRTGIEVSTPSGTTGSGPGQSSRSVRSALHRKSRQRHAWVFSGFVNRFLQLSQAVVTGPALVLLVSGCLGSSRYAARLPEVGITLADAQWTRDVAPFPVLDFRGIPYDIPFLGGFNVPRPQLVDIDGDGDQDLFIQEVSDRLYFFEREPAGANGRYRWQPGMFDDLRVGEWYRFADVDADGDVDLLAEEPFGYVRLYRNVGSRSLPRFELAADTLRDILGEPIFSDRQSIPNAADIDCDGLFDLLIGRLSGTVTRYEATGPDASSNTGLRHVTDRFENIEILGAPDGLPGGPRPDGSLGPVGSADRISEIRPTMRHGANTMALADIDGDADLDLFWGDFFEPGLLFIENVGTCAQPNLRREATPFPPTSPLSTSGYNAPTFGDLDDDGDLDLLVGVLGGAYNPNTTSADNLLHLSQTPDGFQLQTSRFISQIDVGSESVPSLADLDADGDLDLMLANRIDPSDLSTSRVLRFNNTGTSARPRFQAAGTLEIEGAYHNVPAFGDLDDDGDLDVILGTWRSELQYLENIGTAQVPDFRLIDPSFVRLDRGSNAAPALGDIDLDGDLDLIVGEADGTLHFFENVGDREAPRFEQDLEVGPDVDVGRRAVPSLIDGDGDGDLDLVVGTEGNGIAYYENRRGSARASFVEAASPLPDRSELPGLSAPALGDLDGDGDVDLVVGGVGGGAYFFRNGSVR